MTFTDKFLDNDGVRIHYEVEEGDGPTVVLVHGHGREYGELAQRELPGKAVR